MIVTYNSILVLSINLASVCDSSKYITIIEHYLYVQNTRDGTRVKSKVILKEGWAFIGVHRVNHRYIIQTKLIIELPIDVISHLYGWSNDSL